MVVSSHSNLKPDEGQRVGGTLDAFLEPQIVKSKQDLGIYVQEKCSDCGEVLGSKNPLYTLLIKGEKKPYCRECAIKRLPKPKPKEEENKEEANHD